MGDAGGYIGGSAYYFVKSVKGTSLNNSITIVCEWRRLRFFLNRLFHCQMEARRALKRLRGIMYSPVKREELTMIRGEPRKLTIYLLMWRNYGRGFRQR